MFDKIYTKSKLEDNKSKLRSFWQGKNKTVYSSYSTNYEYRQVEDYDLMVENACKNIMDGCNMPGTNIPRLICDFGTTSTAEFFGGKAFKPEGCNKWINPIIHSVDDLHKIKVKPSDSLDVQKAYKLYSDVSEKLGTTSLPTSYIDFQGPLGTLALMWEQSSFMMAMYDHPKKLHEILEMVTYKLIDIMETMLNHEMNVEAPLWPYVWMPKDIGIGITQDYMPLLSPDLYKEFGLPYLKIISDHFGGVFIHCCGQFTQHIDNLVDSGVNVLGMEFVYPNVDIKHLFNKFGSSALFVPNLMDNQVTTFGSVTDYFKYVNGLRNKETRLWYILNSWQDDLEEQAAFVESICD